MPISVIPRTLGSVQRPALVRHRIEGKEQPGWLMPRSESPDACRLRRSQHQDFPYVVRTRISVLLTVAHAIGSNPAVCAGGLDCTLNRSTEVVLPGNGGQHRRAALTEADPHKPGLLTPRAQDHRVAILKEASRLAVRQLNRLLAAHGEFE
jgi:hypothetical protein